MIRFRPLGAAAFALAMLALPTFGLSSAKDPGLLTHRDTRGQLQDVNLADVVASKGMLVATGYVDPARIGIVGGSYGGYMVLAALTLQPDAFRVGVDLFGISNWSRTLSSIPAWWGSARDALYAELETVAG